VENTTASQLTTDAARLYQEAKALLLAGGADNMEKAERMVADAKEFARRANHLSDIESALAEQKAVTPLPTAAKPQGFKSIAEFMSHVYLTKRRNAAPDPRLRSAKRYILDDGDDSGGVGWIEAKTMVENIGADGGFLVPEEWRADFFMLTPFGKYIRERALVMPMRHRQVTMPYLDQTGSTAGKSNITGGVQLYWTEEAQPKSPTQPEIRQFSLIAHKLAAISYISDELLEDSAIELEALLTRLFSEATVNEHDYTFIQGTGAGQPLGVVTANVDAGLGPTIVVPRAGVGAIAVQDIFDMLTAFSGQSPIWLAHQSTMPEILSLAGPAGNPSYVWIQNMREGAPVSLMGYPIYFIENCPTLGDMGDLILADFSKYVIGNRKELTIDASRDYRFADDITTWRAVSRIAGRPWLRQPLTLRDGATQVSPFVILDGAGAS
jgi:HK97 family phage major capsid protein